MPCQIVPPSIVKKTNISIPEVVNVGAVPAAQATLAGQLTVWLPPLVKNKVNEHEVPDADGLEKVKVVVPVSTVPEITFPSSISIS